MVNIITSIILQILLDLDNSAPDSGSTLKNVLHQLFGWTVAIGEDIKKAVHKEHGVGKIFVNMYSKVMEKRDKTLHKEADKLTQILEKLEALDESVDTALGNIHEIERQKQRLRNPANSSTVSINTENHLREVRKNIVEIEKEISDAFKDIGDDEPKSVLLGAEMEQERKSMEIEKRKSMDEKRNEEKRKSTTVTSPVKDNQ
jgi:F0F1-type ATP synthase membrane subunit b/b'